MAANWQRLQQTSKDLLKISLDCRVSAEQFEDPKTRFKEIPRRIALKKEKENCVLERIACEAELRLREQLSKESLGDSSLNQEALGDLQERIEKLTKDLASIQSHYAQSNMVLESLHSTEHLLKTFGSEKPNHKSLSSLVDSQACLVSEVLRNLEKLREVKTEWDKARRARGRVQLSCRQFMSKIQDLKQQSHSSLEQQGNSDYDRLHQGCCEATLLSHTLQSLVVGSGVDWSQDEQLLQLMLTLGQSFAWENK